MPSITREDATLHFEDCGVGVPVILHHPLSADGRSWWAIGVVDALQAAGFRVIVPDALGHGKSDPSPPHRVGLKSRVLDLLAITSSLGIERFHFCGYSMGGWVGTGLVSFAPQHLLSLEIAGWDPIDGARHFTQLTDMQERRGEFERTIATLTDRTPGRPQPAPATISGYVDTYERLFKDIPSIVSLVGQDFPLMLSVGKDDPYRPAVAAAAEALDVDYVELPGDHIGAFLSPEFRNGVIDWIKKVHAQVDTGI